MQELGCVDAINLDGGGSTAIGGIFPGEDDFLITNRPSDGAQRRCANYLFLQDLREKTGIVWYVDWREDGKNFLAGTSYQLEALKVYDTGNYKMDGLTNITYSLLNSDNASATISDTGLITFRGTGQVNVTVTGEKYNKTFTFETYETPEELRIIDEATGNELTELSIDKGTMKNFSLEAAAYVNGVRLEAYPSLFKWETNGSMAEVDEDGTVSVKDDGSEIASVVVSVGDVSKEIPIKVVEKSAFDDTNTHWAKDIIEEMAEQGIINGFVENNVSLFKPDDNITRIQFAAMASKAMGISETDYADTKLNFTDTDKIQDWAIGYVKAMVALGYISGRSDDDGKTAYFDPDNTITRAEGFTIMGRIVGVADGQTLSYTDTDQIPDWAVMPIATLRDKGLIQGFEDNTIRPNKSITRAESATLISKFRK